MKKLFLCVLAALILAFAVNGFAADVTLKWEAAPLATGYNLYYSTDLGITWSSPIDAGNVLEYEITGVPDIGVVLFRVGAYNSYAETLISWQGGWYCGEWMPPGQALNLGVSAVSITG